MLIVEVKPDNEILPLLKDKIAVICCEGCREVFYPDDAVAGFLSRLLNIPAAETIITADYICNPDNLLLQTKRYLDAVNAADTLIIISCGAGVQTAAEIFPGKTAIAACDTYQLPGYQGLTPLEHDCEQCGECHLNSTGGICPVTSCAKSLLNGQCGGARDGMCEVDREMECGWERIYKRLEALGDSGALRGSVKVRNF